MTDLSEMPTQGGNHMKREFKISVVSELESGKPQIATEHGIHSSIPYQWQYELAENPERANSFNGDRCKYEARIAQALEASGQAHVENELGRPKGQSQPAIGASRSF